MCHFFLIARAAPLPWTGIIVRMVTERKHEEASITFSGDGKMMIFSSDRPGGMGRLDLYFCTKDDKGKWTDPQNIGKTLNTQYDEDSPF